MTRVFETEVFRLVWGYNVSSKSERYDEVGIYEPDYARMQEAVDALIQRLHNEEWEIKSVVPLTAAPFATEVLINRQAGIRGAMGMGPKAVGGGLAFSAPVTQGVIVVVQRAREVSETELAASRQARADREAKEQRQAARESEAARIRKEEIEEVSAGLFSAKFRFRGATYKTIEEARAAREKLAADTLAGTAEPGGP